MAAVKAGRDRDVSARPVSRDPIISAIHDSAARGFDRAAGEYERGRPEYPSAAIELLVSEL